MGRGGKRPGAGRKKATGPTPPATTPQTPAVDSAGSPVTKSSLTSKQQRFVAEYLSDLNATQAAVRCGYSERTAKQQGSRLLTNAVIAAAVAAGTVRHLEKAELSAVRVLEELRRLATIDMRLFFDARGNMKPISELTAEQGAALASFEVIKKNAEAGDGVIDTVHKFKVWDKVRALEMLAKHFKLLTEKIEVNASDDLLARLDRGRQRTNR